MLTYFAELTFEFTRRKHVTKKYLILSQNLPKLGTVSVPDFTYYVALRLNQGARSTSE